MKWIGLNINLFKHYGNQLRTNFFDILDLYNNCVSQQVGVKNRMAEI